MSNFTESQITMNEFQPFSSTSVDFEKIFEGIPTFGKIKLNINKFPNTKKHLDLEFDVDNSGSMSFSTPDGKTKMEHMNFTVENILRYLQEHHVSATVCVNIFDDNIINIVKPQELNSENIEDISKKIRKIRPMGGTNIEKVLQMEASFKKPENYSSERIFLMFTDGQDNNVSYGNTSKKNLKEIADKISDTTTIVTIGCGTDHDYELLSSIASRRNSTYKFIGRLEEAAMACGEVLDKILNKILKNVEITVQNGEIYDWKTNQWTNKIQTENIIGECDKTYNIRSLTPHDFNITITGIIVETDELFEYSITDKNMDQDLKKDIWRQETLELLYEVNEYNKTYMQNQVLIRELKNKLKNKLKKLMVDMKKYMDDNKLRDDLFMKMLTDDIFTAYATFGTAHGHMYVASRQTSQATQGIHNNTVYQVPNNHFYQQTHSYSNMPDSITMTRGLTCRVQQMVEDDEFDLLRPPAIKRGVTQYMQAMNVYDDDDDDDDNEEEICGDIMTCSMSVRIEEDKDISMEAVPKLKKETGKNVGFVDKEEEDVFSKHITLESDISPYANIKTVSLMREVSCTPRVTEDQTNCLK